MAIRVARSGVLALGLLIGTATISLAASPPALSVTAARPGVPLVSAGPTPASQSSGARRHDLTSGEGAGAAFCRQHHGHRLGASFDSVFTCGPSTGTSDDFDMIGFQCVELSERFLWVEYGDFIPNVMSGKELVSDGSTALGLPIGTPGVGSLPAIGDVVSMWGGPKAQAWGHTAVVTSLNVDSSGNGTVGIMEENGAANGWDQLTVTNWNITFGDPNWDGGYYYYNHVEWLELQPNPPTLTGSVIQFQPQGLGANSVATAINGTGTVSGYIAHSGASGNSWLQPFLFHDNTWSYPQTPSRQMHVVGLNNHGAVAGWAPQHATTPAGYILRGSATGTWNQLPSPDSAPTVLRTTSIDGFGDVTGWMSTNSSGLPTSGLLWSHASAGYQVKALTANRNFNSPTVLGADHYGDAIGTEMLGQTQTYAVVWAPWGKAYRLPGLSTEVVSSVARAMTAKIVAGTRTLSVVGSSTDDLGVPHAVEWTVTVGTDSVQSSAPALLDAGTSLAAGPSDAVAINPLGWVVGTLGSTGTSGRVFLFRPSFGMVDLQSLLPVGSNWVLESVAGVNASGTVIGQGYNAAKGTADDTRAILLTPAPVPPPSTSPGPN